MCNVSSWSHDRCTASSKSSMAYRSYYYFLHHLHLRLSTPVWHGGAQVARQRQAPTAAVATPFAGEGRRTLQHPLLNTIYIYMHYFTTTSTTSDYYIIYTHYTLLIDKRQYTVPLRTSHSRCRDF